MQLWDYFQAQVTAEDGMENAAQCFLSAALKLGRPPNKCVVFDSSPAGVTAAHNCTMKVRERPMTSNLSPMACVHREALHVLDLRVGAISHDLHASVAALVGCLDFSCATRHIPALMYCQEWERSDLIGQQSLAVLCAIVIVQFILLHGVYHMACVESADP